MVFIGLIQSRTIRTLQQAAHDFQVPESTLWTQLHATALNAEKMPMFIYWLETKKNHFYNSHMEQPPDRLSHVQEMANILLWTNVQSLGKNWHIWVHSTPWWNEGNNFLPMIKLSTSKCRRGSNDQK